MEDDLRYDKELLTPYKKILKTVSLCAYENFADTYAVGGFVRDIILGRKISDIDFVVVGDVMSVAEDVAKALGIETISKFENFGTVHMETEDGMELEFVMSRKESYTRGSRKPQVEPGSLHDDISRRDFTINCMAVSLNRTTYGDLIDEFGGLRDLNNGILKTPLSPSETFDDDPLRIVRMARFASQLDFIPDELTALGAAEMSHRLSIVSQERISTEFMKIMRSCNPTAGLKILAAIDAFEVICPEIHAMIGQEQRSDYHHKDVFGHTMEVLDKLSLMTKDPWIRLAGLLHDIGKPLTKELIEGIGYTFRGHEEEGAKMIEPVFKNLKLPLHDVPMIKTVVGLHGRFRGIEREEVSDAAIRRLIRDAGDFFDELFMVYLCDYSTHNPDKIKRMEEINEQVKKKIDEVKERSKLLYEKFVCPVNGNEIMEYFELTPGRSVGDIKRKLEEAIMEGLVENDHDKVYEYMIKNIEK